METQLPGGLITGPRKMHNAKSSTAADDKKI